MLFNNVFLEKKEIYFQKDLMNSSLEPIVKGKYYPLFPFDELINLVKLSSKKEARPRLLDTNINLKEILN